MSCTKLQKMQVRSSGESAAHLRHSSSCCMTVHAQQARALKVGCTAGAGWLHTGGLPALPRHGRGRAADAGAAAACSCFVSYASRVQPQGCGTVRSPQAVLLHAQGGLGKPKAARLAASLAQRVVAASLPQPGPAGNVHVRGSAAVACAVPRARSSAGNRALPSQSCLLLQVLTFEHAFAILLVLGPDMVRVLIQSRARLQHSAFACI